MMVATFLPARENFLDAITEAVSHTHSPTAKLYHDGKRCAWLPRQLPGWHPINAAVVKVAA